MVERQAPQTAPHRHRWPWIVAAFVLVGIVLAVWSVKREAQRIRDQRQFQMDPGTNAR